MGRELLGVTNGGRSCQDDAMAPGKLPPCLRWKQPGAAFGQAAAATLRPPHTALIMSKIGRYIATIMPPTTTPRTTIIAGSTAAMSTSSALSTSSS